MHRKSLEALLYQYNPTPEETWYKEKMLQFLDSYENCFQRSLAIGHFTASAWLESQDGRSALLLHHAKLDIWVQPGGHADGDHDLLAVAIKEAQEESGIFGIVSVSDQIFDIDMHRIPANSKEAEHDHYDVRFLLKVVTDEQFVQNRESKAMQWIDKHTNQFPTQERSVVRMFEKWKNL